LDHAPVEDVPDEEDRPASREKAYPPTTPPWSLRTRSPAARTRSAAPLTIPSMKRASNICHSPLEKFTRQRITAQS
jgi:anti-sigma factor RsiW